MSNGLAAKSTQIETVFMRYTVGQQPRALGKGAMVACYIINTLNNLDLTGNNVNVMVGAENGQPEELLPGTVSSLIYARDLENVYARAANPAPVVLSLGSDVSVRGTYTFRGLFNGKPFYNLIGEDDDPVVSSISWSSGVPEWDVFDGAGVNVYVSASDTFLPSLADWAGSGTAQQLSNTVVAPAGITGNGNVNATIQAAGFNGGVPLVVPVAVIVADDADQVAVRVRDALNANGIFAAFFEAAADAGIVTIAFDTIAANDATASLSLVQTTATGLTPTESTITTPGVANAVFTEVDGVDITIKMFRRKAA